MKMRRRRWKLFRRLERWWPLLFGIPKDYPDWLFAEEQDNNRIERYLKEELKKNALPPRQRVVPRVDRRNGKIIWIGLWIDSSSTLFSGFGSVRFLSVPKLENLARWKFSSNEEVIVAVNEYFASFETIYFSDGIKKVETHWTKCIALDADCVEK